MARQRKFTDQQLAEAVANETTIAGVLRRLGYNPHGGCYDTVRRYIERLGLDVSHFTHQGWAKGNKKTAEGYRGDLLPLLVKGGRVNGLRNRLISAGIKEAKCEECGLTEWRGQPAPLQVDHVDGDRSNNELNNLRILCANCHMLTETWGSKKRAPVVQKVETQS